MKKMIAAAVVLLLCILLSGCHTVKGIGEDVQGGGRAIERSSGK